MLECAMYLMDEAQLSWRCRGNPVNVSRKISSMVRDRSLFNLPESGRGIQNNTSLMGMCWRHKCPYYGGGWGIKIKYTITAMC